MSGYWNSPRDYPRCKSCGHDAATHGQSFCTHKSPPPVVDGAFRFDQRRKCDCTGWALDPNWPGRAAGATS